MTDVIGSLGIMLVRSFAAPTETFGLGLGRLTLGLVLLVDLAWKLRDRSLWYEHLATTAGPSKRILAVHGVALVLFTIGLFTHAAAAALLVTSALLARRNRFIVYGGDSFTQVLVLLLMLSPCARSWSVDALSAGDGLGLRIVAPPWGGRLAQIEVLWLYLSNTLVKLREHSWRDGSALHFVMRNANFTRKWVPEALRKSGASRALTWGTLGLEGAFALGLGIDSVALPVWVLAIAFHLGITALIDVHLFGPIMMAALTLFVRRSWLGTEAPSVSNLQHVGFGASVGVAVCSLYVVAVVAHDLLVPGAWRAHVGEALGRIGLHRGWELFVGDPPCAAEVRVETIRVFEDGSIVKEIWDPRRAVQQSIESPVAGGLPLRHRVERFKFALARSAEARSLFSKRFNRSLRTEGSRIRAASAAVVFLDVVDEPGANAVVPSVRLATVIARRPGGGLDVASIRALGAATNASATLMELVDILLAFTLEGSTCAEHQAEARAAADALVDRLEQVGRHTPDWETQPGFPPIRIRHFGELAAGLTEDRDRVWAQAVVVRLSGQTTRRASVTRATTRAQGSS